MITREQRTLIDDISYDIGDDLFGYISQNREYIRRSYPAWDIVKQIRV
jgi:hypothetical protein